MKKNFLKTAFLYLGLLIMASLVLVSCKKDDDDDDVTDVVLDGYYIQGAGTGLTELSSLGKMKPTKNEVGQADRATLLEYYVAVKAGSDGFNIVKVEGGKKTLYGPGTDFAVVDTAGGGRITDEPKKPYDFSRGSLAEGTKFTVTKDALYHVVYDTELEIAVVAEAAWGIIGGATPGGWSDNTQLTSTFDLNKIEFVLDTVLLFDNDWKFRYSNGWKIVLDGEVVRVNCNLGGAVDALVAGGDNITNATYGVYKVVLTWELGKAYTSTVTFVKDGPPRATYPEELYMIGASIGGWDWAANGIQMIPTHSNPHLFWKIVWIEKGVADAGIKFAPAKAWGQDFGVVAADGATAGVWKKGSDNVPDENETGYYLVVVNLATETVEIIAPNVYGIGDAFGSWDASNAANLFTVDAVNKVMESPAITAAGDLRIHVASPTMRVEDDSKAIDWWQAEFVLTTANVIEYRGIGGDQARTAVTAGQVVTLDFINETGSID